MKMRKCVDGGMQDGGGRGGGGEDEDGRRGGDVVVGGGRKELKEQNEVLHYHLWSPLFPVFTHYSSYLWRKGISLVLGGGVCGGGEGRQAGGWSVIITKAQEDKNSEVLVRKCKADLSIFLSCVGEKHISCSQTMATVTEASKLRST